MLSDRVGSWLDRGGLVVEALYAQTAPFPPVRALEWLSGLVDKRQRRIGYGLKWGSGSALFGCVPLKRCATSRKRFCQGWLLDIFTTIRRTLR